MIDPIRLGYGTDRCITWGSFMVSMLLSIIVSSDECCFPRKFYCQMSILIKNNVFNANWLNILLVWKLRCYRCILVGSLGYPGHYPWVCCIPLPPSMCCESTDNCWLLIPVITNLCSLGTVVNWSSVCEANTSLSENTTSGLPPGNLKYQILINI